MSRLWTPELEAKARELKAAGVKNPVIAETIGVKLTTVISYFWRNGLGGGKPQARRKPSPHSQAPATTYSEPSVRRFSWEQAQ